MASKNISITEEIYSKLKRLKRPNESFSGVIGRLLKKQKNPFDFIGIWEDWDNFDLFEEGINKAKECDKPKGEQIINSWVK
ncbi:MAG: antitoxin VapB family protein [Promethearchaeota archaeon]